MNVPHWHKSTTYKMSGIKRKNKKSEVEKSYQDLEKNAD